MVHIEGKTFDPASDGRKEGFLTFEEKSRHKTLRTVASAVVAQWKLDVLGSTRV